MSGLLKKIAFYTIIILGIIYGYKYFTGKNLADLPGEINAKIQQKDTSETQIKHQYSIDKEKDMLKE